MKNSYSFLGKIPLLLAVLTLYCINISIKAQTISVIQGNSICFEDGNYEISGSVENVIDIYAEVIIGDGGLTTTLIADAFTVIYHPVITDIDKTLQIYIRFDGVAPCPSKEVLVEFMVTEFCVSPCPEFAWDIEGHQYKVTYLAGLCWTENLKSTLYTCSGETIPFAKPYTCSGCPAQLDTIFGLLYDWYSAIGDSTNCICPDGFHIPSYTEWSLLESYPASQLRSTQYWLVPPAPGTDDYGFDARPAGWYNGSIARFVDLYGYTGWWSSDSSAHDTASYFYITYYCANSGIDVRKMTDGLSVRCVMNNN